MKKNIQEKTINEIFSGISELSINGDPRLLTISNIAKRSGYSIGNIYHHFKNFDELIEKFVARRVIERTATIIQLIDEASPTSTAVEILKTINDANFDYLAIHAPRGLFKKIAIKFFYKKSFVDQLDVVALLLVKPLQKMINKNETNTFRQLILEEIEIAVLMMVTAKRKPFMYSHKLAGTNTHRQQTLRILLALLSK